MFLRFVSSPRPGLTLGATLSAGQGTAPAATQAVHTCSVLSGWGKAHRGNSRNQRAQRHILHQWRDGRSEKIFRPDLPDVEFQRRAALGKASPEEIREAMKEQGKLPPARQSERAIFVSSTGDVMDKFVPPEGDGKASLLSKEGSSTAITGVAGKGKSFVAARKIRQYEENFSPKIFGDTATQVYIDAHTALANRDLDGLHKLATELVYPEMVHNIDSKTLRWTYIKALEPPRVVHVRTQNVLVKTNLFAQVTVRMNSQQTLAVYDRFGRLIHGSEHVAKDVLEYVVFEKHISNLYGTWRLHSKVVPEWMPARPPSQLTYVQLSDKAMVEEEEERPDKAPTPEEDEKRLKEEEEAMAVNADDEKVYNRFGQVIKK